MRGEAMRDQRRELDVRCPSCNDEWLDGRLTCRDCGQPLRVRWSFLYQPEDTSPLDAVWSARDRAAPLDLRLEAPARWWQACLDWWDELQARRVAGSPILR